jgi:hypothetical protein
MSLVNNGLKVIFVAKEKADHFTSPPSDFGVSLWSFQFYSAHALQDKKSKDPFCNQDIIERLRVIFCNLHGSEQIGMFRKSNSIYSSFSSGTLSPGANM